MRADVPAYTADGLHPVERYRLEIERRITQGVLPADRAERVTAEVLARRKREQRHRNNSQRHRDAPECGCGQRCGYIKPDAERVISVPHVNARPMLRAPSSPRHPDRLVTLSPFEL